MKIKKQIYRVLKSVPLIRAYNEKIEKLKKQIEQTEAECRMLADENINYRLKMKTITQEKINVVFVCHRPAIWGSLHSVYKALVSDENFNVSVVAIPNKKELKRLGLRHENYESEGAEDFWKEYNCINGYNYEKDEWLDLRELSPDYVFFQQPYNITRCELYKSWNISKYAKICYVAYAANFIGGDVFEETTPKDYVQNVSLFFTQNKMDDTLVRNLLKKYENNFTKTVMTGFPRYDGLTRFVECESDVWNYKKNDKRYRVLWTPRWCTNEGNCCFFDYKDKVLNYFSENEEFDFVFRPHPQAFVNWNRTGEFPEREAEIYKKKYYEKPNMNIDFQKEYFHTIYSSDCLISDVSSFMSDYFMTGKPIIYCHKINMFNEVSSKMSEGFYWVRTWDEIVSVLENLKRGIDPLKGKRKELLRELSMDISNTNAGEKIKTYILDDARKI